MVKITTVEVRGKKYDVSVNNEGKFFADCGRDQIKADSLDKLRAKLARVTLQVTTKLAIEFIEWHQGKMRRGVCIGKHATNRNLLVKYDDGRSEQVASWSDNGHLKPAVAAQYEEICKTYDAAVAARREFEKKHGLNLSRLVDDAYQAAEASGGAV